MVAKASEYLASLPAPLDRKNGASVKDCVKRIREELAGALKCGALPKGTKLSIRNTDYNVIHVDIVEWSHDGGLHPSYVDYLMECVTSEIEARKKGVEHPERNRKSWDGEDRFRGDWSRRRRAYNVRGTDALNDALALCWDIADRHNYDNSDAMTDYFDVGYYLHVEARTVISTGEHGIRMELDTEFCTLVQRGIEASKRLGPKVTASVCGRQHVEHCSEWKIEELLRLDERAQGRTLVYDKKRRGWFVESSAA